MFHMGWFVGRGYSVHAWNQPWSGTIGADYMQPDLYVDLVKAMERACFDYVMIEDGSFVPDAYQGTPEWYLHNAYTVPKHDPMPLVPLLTQGSSHLGIVATMTTGFYPPYLAARLGATLDHLTKGRVGLNLVTAHNDRTAQNFGLERHHEHDLRYEIADEWIQVVDRLWQSWEPDAVVADPQTGMYADFRKVHPIDFVGKYFSSRGPLNMPPGPQRRPVICQAGMSPAGREFAAKYADTIVAVCRGAAAAKRYRDDVRLRMARHGRNPDHCKVMFSVRHRAGRDAGGRRGQEGTGRRSARPQHGVPSRPAVLPERPRFLQVPARRAAARGQDQRLARPDGIDDQRHRPRHTARNADRSGEAAASTSSAPRTASPPRWARPPRKWAATAS